MPQVIVIAFHDSGDYKACVSKDAGDKFLCNIILKSYVPASSQLYFKKHLVMLTMAQQVLFLSQSIIYGALHARAYKQWAQSYYACNRNIYAYEDRTALESWSQIAIEILDKRFN